MTAGLLAYVEYVLLGLRLDDVHVRLYSVPLRYPSENRSPPVYQASYACQGEVLLYLESLTQVALRSLVVVTQCVPEGDCVLLYLFDHLKTQL